MATSYKPVTALEVRIWGQTVGAVALEPSRGYCAFEYDKRFVAKGIELAPLRMPLKEAAKPFIFGFLPEATYRRLPAMLADALPDDFGNALIDAWMASKGLRQKEITTLDRLAYMGKRGMGALELRPSRGANTESATAITELGMGPDALREALRRMVFNVMAGNLDDHTKNFAFLMRQGAPWALAPAYDITHAFNPGSEWVYQHLMSVDSKFINITRADVQAVAERHGLRLQVGPIVDQVQDALDRWPEFAAEAGVATHEVASIAQDIARFSTGLQKPGR